MKFKIVQDPILKLDSNKVKSILKEFLEGQIPKEDKKIKPKFPMDFILFKFPNIKTILSDLLTVTFKDYIDNIYVVAPKPTTFKVVLKNQQYFNIIYNERSYIVKVEGKKYYMINLGEKENAIEKIANLLNSKKFITSKTDAEEEEKDDKKETKSKKSGGGGSSKGGSSKDEPLPDLDSILGPEGEEGAEKPEKGEEGKEEKPEEPLKEIFKIIK